MTGLSTEKPVDNEGKFVAFVAAMMKRHPEKCYANVSYASEQPRQLQPYITFLEVLTEHDSTVKELIKRGMGTWSELDKLCFKNDALKSMARLQGKLDGQGRPPLKFGGTGGAHRKPPMRKDFARAVFEYATRAKGYGGPEGLISPDWKPTHERVTGIHSFGPLAIFDYLERLCLLGFTSPPDEYLLTGGGPSRGIEAIYQDSQDLREKGNRLLHLLTEYSRDARAVFALETFLCCMQKDRIRDAFVEYFKGRLSLDDLIDEYLKAFDTKGPSPLCPR